MNNTFTFAVGLGILGPAGLLILLILAGFVARHYWGSPTSSFRWHVRNQRLKQVSAVTSFFCLAMAASYGLFHEAWAFIYLLIAFVAGTWWLRITITQRS